MGGVTIPSVLLAVLRGPPWPTIMLEDFMFCCSDPGAVLDAGSLGTGEREPLEPQDGARGLSPPLDVAFLPRSFGWRRLRSR